MVIFWWVVTVLVVVAVVASWYVLNVRGDLIHRSNTAKPEDRDALREVQRQIDLGYSHSDLARYNRRP